MRVSIARALVTRPAVLLLDEPFAALDEITRIKLNDDLAKLQASLGATVVFVTHSVFESVYLSHRIVVMAARPGRAVAEIAIDEPTPRGGDFRLSAAFAETCHQTSIALHEAMDEGDRRAGGRRMITRGDAIDQSLPGGRLHRRSARLGGRRPLLPDPALSCCRRRARSSSRSSGTGRRCRARCGSRW